MRSAGVLDVDDGLVQVLVESVDAESQLAVSVEPDGGSEQPTTTPIVVLPLAGGGGGSGGQRGGVR